MNTSRLVSFKKKFKITTQKLCLSLIFIFALSILQAQNVGIGIANPQVPLHVYKNGINEVLRIQSNGSNGSFLSIYNAFEGRLLWLMLVLYSY